MTDTTQMAQFTRYNTGTHFLDSGGDGGRAWQQELPGHPLSLDFGDDPTISLTHWLAENAEMDTEIQDLLFAYADANPRASHFEIGQGALEDLGYTSLARDNVYNSENDFDQVFVWEVWLRPGREEPSEWLYADKSDIIVLIYVHTGADVRGGYAFPAALEFGCYDYPLPLDWCAEWKADEEDETTQEWIEEHGISDDEGCCGYSGHPVSHLQDYLDGWEFGTFDPETSVATYTQDEKTIRIFWGLPYAG